MFSEEEKDRFTLLTLDYRYPFPLDLETLAHFYRSSRVFVHTADEERRCRVAAYAWASGVPVVGMSCVGSLLPKELRTPPYFYQTSAYPEFPDRIVEALSAQSTSGTHRDCQKVRECFSVEYTRARLAENLARLADSSHLQFGADRLALCNLDIRLGRHHGIGSGPNTVSMSLADFIGVLLDQEDVVARALKQRDPEREVERLLVRRPKVSLFRKILGR
jgi:hypothetical protein